MRLTPIQLFDSASSTYTYILAIPGAEEAVIIDPVDTQIKRDMAQLERLGLKLRYILETHAHADHITSAGRLACATGAETAVPAGCGITRADHQLRDGDILTFAGKERILALHTPGHTAGSMCFVWRGNVFTGDTLLIDGCGRTDFQGGDARALYRSVTQKLFTLPEPTLVWPAHDYNGQAVSTIGWEKRRNRRFAGRDEEGFVETMKDLSLPRPKLMDRALPANARLGMADRS